VFVAVFEAERGHARGNLGDLRRRGMKMFINQRVITYAAIGLRDVETFQGLRRRAAARRRERN
jgi:hypothetical protein